MYRLNDILYTVSRTWIYEGEKNDPNNGVSVVCLVSDCGRYSIITDATTWTNVFEVIK